MTILQPLVKKEAVKLPKRYSDREREEIRRRLKEEAAGCIAQFGIRHTTVDELVKRIGIPKGTFYLFYNSKEMLLFETIAEQQELIEQEFTQALQAADQPLTSDTLAGIILHLHKRAETLPALKGLRPGEIELLAQKLPPEVLTEHFAQDSARTKKLFAALLHPAKANPEAFSAAFRAIYLVTAHRKGIGEQSYDEALKLLIQGLTLQMLN